MTPRVLLIFAFATLPCVAEAQRQRPRPSPRVTPRAATPVAPAPPPVIEAPPPSTPAPIEAPAPVTPTEPSAAPTESSPAGTRPVALDLSLGVRGFHRALSINEDLFGVFRPYDLPFAPALVGAVEWYPAAHVTDGWLAGFGLVATGDYAFALSSRDTGGQSRSTLSYGVSGALRYRIMLGASELGLSFGYGLQSFTIDAPRPATDQGVPSVSYRYLRGGVNTRIALSPRFALLLGAGYLHVLSAGDLSEVYFTRATVGAVDASVGLAIGLVRGLEVRATFDGRRYFYAMNPEPGDAYIVGGAIDQYLSGSLALAWRR